MLRIKRILKSALTPESIAIARSLDQWVKELSGRVSRETLGLLPVAREDGEYLSYFTKREGEAAEFTGKPEELNKEALGLLEGEKDELLRALRAGEPFSAQLEGQKAALTDFVERCEHLFLFENTVPVLLPYDDGTRHAPKPVVAEVPPAPPVKKRGCLLPFLLLLLLLLLLLGLLWWFLLRPWPMQGTFGDALNALLERAGLSSYLKEDYSPQEAELEDIQKRAEALLNKPEPEPAKPEPEPAKPEPQPESAPAPEPEPAKPEPAPEPVKPESAKPESVKPAAPAEVKPKPEPQAKPKSEQSQSANNVKPGEVKVPKCVLLKQEGKMPKMVIAFDGSQSMFEEDVRSSRGRTSRLAAAQQAASNLVNSVDPNVDIGLVEINGCPVAKSKGFFTGTQRQALREAIARIDPLRYDGMTPLIDGLRKIASMTDGVNADAVGVLISDGEDTCPVTRNMDVCQVAAAIHRRKPRLKIHTVLIGQDSGYAACVARITGGKVFTPKSVAEMNRDLKGSGAEFKKVCE
ncbi:MAG: VWA domain-containing protein [Succinivibrio sp.]|nr:VWA domain-containing protein [Succinivibrio sp.]